MSYCEINYIKKKYIFGFKIITALSGTTSPSSILASSTSLPIRLAFYSLDRQIVHLNDLT